MSELAFMLVGLACTNETSLWCLESVAKPGRASDAFGSSRQLWNTLPGLRNACVPRRGREA